MIVTGGRPAGVTTSSTAWGNGSGGVLAKLSVQIPVPVR
jgi:hypothetical protein